jgi:signal transduction histidine kinase
MDSERLFARYRELQRYVEWTEEDVQAIHAIRPLIEASFPELVEDFYEEIQRHPDALKVITGGQEQIERLKGTLVNWLKELFSGQYDEDYVVRRWQIGYRHVQIGLDQVYTNAALSRLRRGLMRALEQNWPATLQELLDARRTLNTLLDLDLALIEDAYQSEHMFRQQATERLALIGQVAGGIAHELRNPLNVIKTSVFYLLNARNPSPDKTAKHLERIEKQVGTADEVIVALTNFAKMALPVPAPFDVETHLKKVADEAELPESIQVTYDCPAGLPPALADASQIDIVLGNLIRNAREAMPHGGTLRLAAEPDDPFLQITVADTGNGIATEALPRIMEPFYSTKARGIGLGLAMAKAIIDKNDGRLSVESEPGRGTTFTIQLRSAVGEP